MLILAGNTLSSTSQLPQPTIEWLRNADVVVFEEDRGARAALKRAGVTRDYLKWNEHHDKGAWEEVTAALSQDRTVLYMPDQGMPGSADPGAKLAAHAHTNQIPIKVLPGPTSIAVSYTHLTLPTKA